MKYNIVFNYPQGVNPRLVVTAGKVEIEGAFQVAEPPPANIGQGVLMAEAILERLLGIRVHINEAHSEPTGTAS